VPGVANEQIFGVPANHGIITLKSSYTSGNSGATILNQDHIKITFFVLV